MARRANERLTPLFVTKAKAGRAKPGKHCDGRNLYLLVEDNGSARWAHRYLGADSKDHWHGLGSLQDVGLKEAREKNDAARKLRLNEKIDPIEAKRAKAMNQRLEAAKAITFQECADKYIASHRAGWHNSKHAAQWKATLKTYAGPIISALAVSAVDTPLVMQVLEQEVDGATLWTARPETASRTRQRIERVLDWAKVQGYREGENPARWKDHLKNLLPAKSKVKKVEHHTALPYREMPGFMATLREQEGIAAKAFEFTILTAARTNEALGAKWNEVDLDARIWIVPSNRMKGGREHRAPLSNRVVAILEEMRISSPESAADGFVFPGARDGRPLAHTSFQNLLKRMARADITPHGFRSTFSDWVTECTGFPTEMREMALAHAVGSKVEAAYRRTDLVERRRALMDAWSAFCERGGAGISIVEFPKAG